MRKDQQKSTTRSVFLADSEISGQRAGSAGVYFVGLHCCYAGDHLAGLSPRPRRGTPPFQALLLFRRSLGTLRKPCPVLGRAAATGAATASQGKPAAFLFSGPAALHKIRECGKASVCRGEDCQSERGPDPQFSDAGKELVAQATSKHSLTPSRCLKCTSSAKLPLSILSIPGLVQKQSGHGQSSHLPDEACATPGAADGVPHPVLRREGQGHQLWVCRGSSRLPQDRDGATE